MYIRTKVQYKITISYPSKQENFFVTGWEHFLDIPNHGGQQKVFVTMSYY